MRTDQNKIAEWLRQEVPTLHPAYERAALLMDGLDFPGRSNLVCHACRDICTVIQQFYRVEKTTRADPTTLLNQLDVLWSQENLDDLGRSIASALENEDPGKLPEDVAMPKSILQAVQAVLQEHRRGALNQKDQALNLFQQIAPEAAGRPELFDSQAEQWRELRGWFHKYAHFTLTEKHCEESELRAQFSLLETHLLTMVSTFYEGVEDLDRLLEQQPTLDTVARAVARMAHPEQQRYFFDRLQKPEWIVPLEEKGIFDTLPEPGRDLDKATIWFYDWPAARYLSRMAALEPAIVARIFERLPSTENPYIVRAVLDAALVMPANFSVTLTPQIVKLIRTPYWFASELVGSIALNLASAGEQKAALSILKSLLKVISDPRSPRNQSGVTGRFQKREAVTLLRAHDYATVLHKHGSEFASLLCLPYLKMLCEMLFTAIAEEVTVDRKADRKTEDYSFIWKPRLQTSTYHESAKHLLIPAVLHAAETLCENDANNIQAVVALLDKHRYTVFDRIVFQLLAGRVDTAIALATEKLLDQENFFDSGTRQEYDALAVASFPHLSQVDQNKYLSWIDDGIPAERFEGRGMTPEAIEATNAHWKFQRMSALKDELSSERRAQFALLEERFGEAKSYSNPIAQGGAYAISDRSPMDRETLSSIAPDQVIEHLRTWKPSDTDPFPFGYSKEGLGAVFAGVVADSPERFTLRLSVMRSLDPVYVASALQGFAQAIRSRKEFDVGPVLALALWIAGQPAAKGDAPEAGSEHDFSSAKHIAIDLVQEGLKAQTLPVAEQGTIWQIIDLLSDDDWRSLDYRNADAQTEDAWFHSLNYLRPKAVRAAVQYVQWRITTSGQASFRFSETPELRSFFNRHTDKDFERCLSVWLIFGEFFPFFQATDPAWTESAIPRLFPESPNLKALRDVVWTAYLAANPVYDNAFALLEPQYRLAITIPDAQRLLGKCHLLEHASGLLSHHLLQQYWRGKMSLAPSSLLSDFFLYAEERARWGAIVYVGQSLRETTDEVPVEVIQRLMELWDNRLEAARASGVLGELRAFSWWFFTKYFDDEWALRSLHLALKLNGGQLEMIMESLGRLSRLVEKYPVVVVDCTQMIIDASPEYVDLWTSDIVTILKSALRSTDSGAPIEARKLIENLGIRGYLGYRNLLDSDPSASDTT